ncbi:MAG: RES family NAD+ phosphorylase [Actinomycetota bacterium]|nr:RES family NAD+ phosphorylase [Actinomycetota bacterium]MDP9327586.1 RES family NAD+ phosphorylase [Actinomycetota bacterium]
MRFRHVTRGGPHVRVADPVWLTPLDPRFAQERGGRWNPPGSFPVVYVCATRGVARAVVLRRFEGLPYGVVDLLPSRAPVLIETDVPEGGLVDVVGDAGCRAAGLPASYPFDGRGRPIPWGRTQPVGEAAWEQGERGVACRSAAMARREPGEELAWFVRGSADRLRVTRRRAFEEWF